MKTRWPFCLLLAACGSEPEVVRPLDIPADAVPQIVVFEATPSRIHPRETVELRWDVKNARVLEIFDAQSTLISTYEPSGTVRTPIIRRDQKFFLRASNREKTAHAEVGITVDWEPTTIEALNAMQPVRINSFMPLSWTTTHADIVRIELDDTEILRWEVDQDSSNTHIPMTTYRARLKFIAWNQTGAAEQELDVRAELPAAILRFAIQPRVRLSSFSAATMVWSTNGSLRAVLYFSPRGAGGTPVAGFPGTPEGSYEVSLAESGDFTLSIEGVTHTANETIRVEAPNPELEPNDTRGRATRIDAGATGTIETTDDVDFYVHEPERSLNGMRIYTLREDGAGCGINVRLTVYARDEVLATSTGDCDRIELTKEQVDFARGGTYLYVVVESENGETGSYALLTEDL